MPIKRANFIQPLSREHHQALLLCWKIKTGLQKKIDPRRIKDYVNWFYAENILPHFKIEETYLYPILPNDNVLVQRALKEHRQLENLFLSQEISIDNLSLIETELQAHVRFEERELFNEIQLQATTVQMELVAAHHHETDFIDNTKDVFWE